MNNKRIPLFLLFRMVLFCLISCSPLAAYQNADGNPAVLLSGAKYIFYWGKLQCDLSPANQYSGKYSCTAAEFRQILHSTPYLWTGNKMAEQVAFQLEGLPVVATHRAFDYTALIGVLDELVGQKVVAGQVLRITHLQLDEQTSGQIELMIEAQGAAQSEPRPTAPTAASNMLHTRFLQQVIWGREDIYENSNRDFFSETEFWRTVQQLPVVEWAPYTQAQPILASIRLHDLSETAFSLRANLEAPAYRQMVENLENYRHLLKPGSVVTLSLHSADQYERLFEKNMYIVGPDDPRLALRRNRDTHTLRISWGGWKETIDNLYLLKLNDAAGRTIDTDPAIEFVRGMRKVDMEAFLKEQTEFWIDDQAVPDMSFQLQAPTQTLALIAGQALPDSFLTDQDLNSKEMFELKLDSFQTTGYALPEISIVLRFYNLAENLRVRNQLSSLLAAPATALVKLHPPLSVGPGYAIDLEVLKETDAKFSIFKPDGENVFTLDNKYPPGRHTVEIPRLVFREPGKYFLFLNTVFGVAKQELLLE